MFELAFIYPGGTGPRKLIAPCQRISTVLAAEEVVVVYDLLLEVVVVCKAEICWLSIL